MNKLIVYAAISVMVGSCVRSTLAPPPPPPSPPPQSPPQSPIESLTIDKQVWMLKNLDVSAYRNGDPLPEVTDPNLWVGLNTGAWCWYNNDSSTYAAIYGKLYNWYAVNDTRGLAPAGWHVPSDLEWTTLSNFLGGDAVAGGAMKEAGMSNKGSTTHWIAPNTGATNSSGFTGLPGGVRDDRGEFNFIQNDGYWWSTTEINEPEAWSRYLGFYGALLGRTNTTKQIGFSVRCLKD
jgi:uncharacterized protein (TIGR02145 family)